MNRREFCLSLGTVIAGGLAVCSAIRETPAVAIPGEPVRPEAFCAKKFHPEQWRDDYSHMTVAQRRNALRHRLRATAADCTALLVTSLAGMPPKFVRFLEAEASRAGLEFYVPAIFPGAALCRGNPQITDVRPLRYTGQTVVCVAESHAAGRGMRDGFRFSFAESRGIILCDASRGTWQTFLSRSQNRQSETARRDENRTNLHTARWLDAAEKRLQYS